MFVHSVHFRIKRAFFGMDKTKKWLNRNPELPTLPDESWYFNKTMFDLGFSPMDFSESVKKSVSELIDQDTKRLNDKIIGIVGSSPLAKALMSNLTIDFFSPKGIYINETLNALIFRVDDNCFFILSEKIENGERIIENIHTDFLKIGATVQEFGYVPGDFITGKAVVRKWLESNKDIFKVEDCKSKNDLEKKVVAIVAQITDCYLSNLGVVFKNPTESFEYDVLVVLHDKLSLNIEVMDYSTVKNEVRLAKESKIVSNLKSNVILSSFDKAKRLGTMSIVILNGFPEDIFENIQAIAKSRGILLFDGEYVDKVQDTLCYMLAMMAKTPMPSFDDFILDYRKRIGLTK
jgi:hypothetical protein